MSIGVSERRQLRSQVLRRVYDLVEGKLSDACGIYWKNEELYEGFEVDREEIVQALDYVANAGLLAEGPMGVYGLTRRGLDEIEDLIATPDKPTRHLAPLIVQHIHNTGQLAIAHGSDIAINQTATLPALPEELEDLARKLQALLGDAHKSDLDAFLKAAAEGDSKFELAARAEPIAKANEGAKAVLKTFAEEISKELGKRTVDVASIAGPWLVMHGQRVYDGLVMLFKSLT